MAACPEFLWSYIVTHSPAYEAAGQANDRDAVAAVVEAQTGEWPSPERRDGVPWLMAIGHAAPRIDKAAG